MGETRQINLSQGEADLAIRIIKPAEKGVVARRLAVVAYGLYGSHDYLANCSEDDWEFLGVEEGLGVLRRWLKELAGERRFVLRSNDLANVLTGARAGLGLAVLPCIMARGHPELVSVPTRLPPLTAELWLVFQRDIGRTPAVRRVIDHITAITTRARAAFLGEQVGKRLRPTGIATSRSAGARPARRIGKTKSAGNRRG
jgi:DNA-binding transcriptional LysR family regulator